MAWLALVLLIQLGIAAPAWADNCSSLSDCYNLIKNGIIAAVSLGIAISLILDLLPVIGDIKGIIEGFTGRDSVTGERLEWWERVLGAIPILGRVGDLARRLSRHLARRLFRRSAGIGDAWGRFRRAASELSRDDRGSIIISSGRRADDVANTGRRADDVANTGRRADDVGDIRKDVSDIFDEASSKGIREGLSEGTGRVIKNKTASDKYVHDRGVEYGKIKAKEDGLKLSGWKNPYEFDGPYGRGIDDIGFDANGNPVIIEYKGGGSDLGQGPPRQMSRAWIKQKIRELRKVNDPMADILEEALNNGKLTGRVYRTPVDEIGRVGKTFLETNLPEIIKHENGIIKY